ncbi:MAG: succinylglutamate desuccinylase/aspartoacylase family protein [Methanobacterium sp.]|uniref:succinylglutamate desuccinylase n=1 Tax=Methanobacterium sp. TaxID=2164 RepID=UPI003D65AC34|nr:succinylglutamate desuccinylase/aspartoacylase family protein [Methanobacterium sp.]
MVSGSKIKVMTIVFAVSIMISTIAYSIIFIESTPAAAAKYTSPQIEVINTATGGNINKNAEITNNAPKTELTQQIISEAKKGTPMIKLGEGDPKIMIIAGVHGEELSPQIAALILINELQGKKLKGTIYIVPFAIPKSSEKNTRDFNNIDPNRAADIPGSPGNVLLAVAQQKNVKFVGEFHSTQPGGEPGKKVVMCSKETSYESFKIAEFMRTATKSDIFLNSKNPGAVKNVFNSAGIPTVTSEVVAAHGTVNPQQVQESHDQMMAFINYSKIL